MKIYKGILLAICIVILTIGTSYASTGWSFGPPLNVPRYGLGVVEYSNKIYAVGGWEGTTALEVFDHNSWVNLSSLPVGQAGLTAALINDKIYTFGNYFIPNDIVQIYDITNNIWSLGPSLPIPIQWATAESIGDKIYIIGGYNRGLMLNTIYILDTRTNTWSRGANMPTWEQIPSSAVFNGEIYVFPLNYKYNISKNSWTPFTGSPRSHDYGAEAITVGNKIYLIGGSNGSILFTHDYTDIYYPSTDKWTIGDNLNIGRQEFGAAYLNGKLYVIGGRNNQTNAEKSVEISVPRLTGDVDRDNQITTSDALLYLRYSVNQNIYPYFMDITYDVTCDGKITASDALKVLRKSVGQNVVLEC